MDTPKMMFRPAPHLAAALSLFAASAALARPGTVTSGDAQFQWANTSASSATLGNVNLRPDGALGTPDHAFQLWWWFRAPGIVEREFAFPDADFGGESYAGNIANILWTNIGVSGARFNARLETILTEGQAPGQASVEQNLYITNREMTTVTLHFFAYADLEAGASTAGDTVTLQDQATRLLRITDTSGQFIDWQSSSAANFAVSRGASAGGLQLRNALNDNAPTTLNNSGLPFTSDDFSGAFQWTLVLPPGVTQVIGHTISVNLSLAAPPCEGDANNDGLINFADVTSVLANFGEAGPAGDADQNGVVNFADITRVLSSFNAPC
ncbi:MAG: hypothetical protein SFZ24_12555 [Planctomycetota bacterium]|nr:hypothetical protein [Planctomycetota bacterium]